jgi:hypothetical protein
MARTRRLKVFRTAIGFHDAYVAAPSRKAALDAWGARNDLFAIGSAELVTDPDLTAEPLAAPGKVIRRVRGSLEDQLTALPAAPARKRPPQPSEPAKPQPKAKAKPRPRPSRAKLDAAEAAMRDHETRAEAELAELRKQEEELQRQRKTLERKHEAASRKLEDRLARARESYEDAMARWRDTL